MMSILRSGLLLLLGTTAALAADPAPPPDGTSNTVRVPTMKTSIYVGNVTLTPSVFLRRGDDYEASYEARVWPWFFWSETGMVSITVSEADLARVGRGETIEFSGKGANQRHKPRTVTGRVQPADATSGKIKIRIGADGLTLVFNGTYRLENTSK